LISVELRERAKTINHTLAARGQMIVTAESCTGGLICGALTDVPGSSEAVFGGYVTYDNKAKTGMIGVPADLIEQHGAVSEQVARAMAEGALKTAGVDIAIAVTGVAGPGGGSEGKPVGLVHFGCASKAGTSVQERRFGDLGRQGIREATVEAALDMVLGCLGVSPTREA
jgi:nicotinamide-nucleotide amidase